jgi:hypothetical protein
MKTNAQLFCTLSALVNVAVPVLSQTAPASIQAPALQRAAPEPARLPDGKPNWTGFWDLPNGFLEVYRGPAGVSGPNRGGGRAGARGGAVNVPQRRTDIPEMKSPYKERYEALLKQAEAGTLPDPGALCLPQGMPGMMGAIYGMEILQTPKIIAISSEFKAGTRRIWMDATHPPADDLDETFTGHSIGRWEGDVLVVDTVGIREDVAMGGRPPLPHSSKLRIVERFRQTAPGTLVDEMTFSDPDVYVASWIEMRTYRYRADLKLQEFVCQENNRNVDPTNGATTFK